MKKVFAIAAALMLIGTTAFAQSIGAGYAQSTHKFGKTSVAANGFYVGVGYTAEIMPGLNLNPGLYYEFLTDDENFSGVGLLQGKTTEHYVNVPLHISYGMDFAPTFGMFIYGGPTASVGIASTTNGAVLNTNQNNYEDDDYSRFDIMLGGGVGVNLMKKIRITVGYDFGMLDRYKDDDYTIKRNRLTAGVAYIF